MSCRSPPGCRPRSRRIESQPWTIRELSFFIVVLGVLAIFLLVTILKTLYTVRTYTAGVVERFGKFNRIVRPGLHVLVPFGETVYFVDLQVKQAQFNVETKTHDNVFVTIPVSVQYQILDDKIYDAFYKLSSPQKQIESFVFNSILGHVPKLTLDETFEQISRSPSPSRPSSTPSWTPSATTSSTRSSPTSSPTPRSRPR